MNTDCIVHYHGPTVDKSRAPWPGGWRVCVIYGKGPKWAHLLDVGTLHTYKIPVGDLRYAKPCPDNVSPRRLAARLKRRRIDGKKAGHIGKGQSVRVGPINDAIAAIKGGD